MDSRPILNNIKKVGILIDSESFEEALNDNNHVSLALLSYFDHKCIICVRTPFLSKNDELRKIPEYKLINNTENPNAPQSFSSVHFATRDAKYQYSFDYRCQNIEYIAKKILKKTSISESELNLFYNVFVQATFSSSSLRGRLRKEVFIFITENEVILRNRLWFESNSPHVQLNIMTNDEASIFLDLFFKKNGMYLARGNYILNKGYWYWLSLRLKIPHFNVGEPIIAALAYRMQYALMALDEMGFQYFQGVDNDTLDNTLYHFNYLISLITGIFDNLALKTNECLGINFPYQTRISLSSNSGKDFLEKINEKDPIIREHIRKHRHLINVMYIFRELVVHREGLEKLSFHLNSKERQWEANFIKISKNEINEICLCGDKKSEYDEISNWGLHTYGNDCFMEPYHFSSEVLNMLIPFIDKYLELLHYSSFVEQQKQIESDFSRTMNIFEKYHLGF